MIISCEVPRIITGDGEDVPRLRVALESVRGHQTGFVDICEKQVEFVGALNALTFIPVPISGLHTLIAALIIAAFAAALTPAAIPDTPPAEAS